MKKLLTCVLCISVLANVYLLGEIKILKYELHEFIQTTEEVPIEEASNILETPDTNYCTLN